MNCGVIAPLTGNGIEISENGNYSVAINPCTEVRLLPSWVFAALGQIVEDRSGKWLELMAAIPSTPPWTPGSPLPPADPYYAKKYTASDVRMLEQEVLGGRVSSSGLNLLLDEWGCSGRTRPTIADLLSLLERVQLHYAAAFLRREVLKESSSDLTAERFLDLDSLIEERGRLASPVHNTTASLTALPIIPSTNEHSELEELLAQQADKAKVTYDARINSNVVTDKGIALLEKLSDEIEQKPNNRNLVRLRTVNFTESDLVVPHVSYNMLQQITNGFSEAPYLEGGRRLGAGAFGVVYKAELPSRVLESTQNGVESVAVENAIASPDNDVRNDVQIKQIAIKKLNYSDERVDLQFKVEVELLSVCCHPNILTLLGYSCDGPSWCLLYDFMIHGNLQERLACSTNNVPLTPSQRLVIGHGTAQGLVYLHTFKDAPMIHRDVKSANILLDEKFLPKLADFGLVRMGGNGDHTETLVKTTIVFGSSAYMAPEAFRGDVSTKLDTFSYGVVLLEILTGLSPYDEHRDGMDLLSHIEGADDEADTLCDPKGAPWPTGLPSALYDMAMLCFEDKKARPSMIDIANIWKPLIEKWD